MRMQHIAGEEAHALFCFSPDAYVPHRVPEKDRRTAIEVTVGMNKLIKLLCSTDLPTAFAMVRFGLLLVLSHSGLFFLIWL